MQHGRVPASCGRLFVDLRLSQMVVKSVNGLNGRGNPNELSVPRVPRPLEWLTRRQMDIYELQLDKRKPRVAKNIT